MTREEAIDYLTILGGIEGITVNEAMAIEIAIEALEQEPILDKIRSEIAEYGSICVEYKLKLTGRRNQDIEQLVTDVLKQAKKQVLEIIDKYKAESEVEE